MTRNSRSLTTKRATRASSPQSTFQFLHNSRAQLLTQIRRFDTRPSLPWTTPNYAKPRLAIERERELTFLGRKSVVFGGIRFEAARRTARRMDGQMNRTKSRGKPRGNGRANGQRRGQLAISAAFAVINSGS